MFFKKFPFLLFKKKIRKSFLVVFLNSLDHFMVFLFALITFESISDSFLRFWKIQKSKMVDQDGLISQRVLQQPVLSIES